MTKRTVLLVLMALGMEMGSALGATPPLCGGFFARLNQQEILLGKTEAKAEPEWNATQVARGMAEWMTRQPAEGEQRADWVEKLKQLDDMHAVSLEKELRGAGQSFERYSRYIPELGLRAHVFAVAPGPHPLGKIAERFWDNHQVGTLVSPLLAQVAPQRSGLSGDTSTVLLPPEPFKAWVEARLIEARTNALTRDGTSSSLAGSIVPVKSPKAFEATSSPNGMRLDAPVARLAELQPLIQKLGEARARFESDPGTWESDVLPLLTGLRQSLENRVVDVTQAAYYYATNALKANRARGVSSTLLGANQIFLSRGTRTDTGRTTYELELVFAELPWASFQLPVTDRYTKDLMGEILDRIQTDRVAIDSTSLDQDGSTTSQPIGVAAPHRDAHYERLQALLAQDANLATTLKENIESDVTSQLKKLVTITAWQLDEQAYTMRLIKQLSEQELSVSQREYALRELWKALSNLKGHGRLHASGE